MPVVRISVAALAKLQNLARLERRTQIAVLDGLLGVQPPLDSASPAHRAKIQGQTTSAQSRQIPRSDLTVEYDE